MARNVGKIDGVIRILLGLGLIAFALGLILPGTGWNWIGWIGVMPILTAFVGMCPAYSLLGLSSRGKTN